MTVHTLSVVVGNRHCDAHCPFCISKQTGYENMGRNETGVNFNEINLNTACTMCNGGDPTTLLFTDKGETTRNPALITRYLEFFQGRGFAPIELQTNGLAIGWLAANYSSHPTHGLTRKILQQWRQLGLNTIALSVVGVQHQANAKIYHQDYPPLKTTIRFLRKLGFTVRLCVMMMHGGHEYGQGYVNSPESLAEVIAFCKKYDVGQLTVRPIVKAYASRSKKALRFIQQYGLSPKETEAIYKHIADHATPLRHLPFGATIFDYDDQNLAAANCLTSDLGLKPGEIRSLIAFRNGTLITSWDHARATTVLQGDPSYD